MPGHPEPQRLTELATEVGGLGRLARAAGDELLDSLVMVGDHGTQRVVDDAVDALVSALRGVDAECAELAYVLGSTGTRGEARRAPSSAPRPAEDHAREAR
ncbi:hypothetical protein [Janibacter sp. UYMM211]|uniref:hypothetical protein n=1 Tax=Janibacter sp. UYMM211 TaxID=3156342 RepID=UPI003398E933